MMSLVLALMFAGEGAAESLEQAKKEPDPVRRYERLIAVADAACARARQIVRESGSRAQLIETLEETAAAAELSLTALKETGKKASKHSKQYKRGELRTRDMEKQMTDIAAALSLEDRPVAEKLRDRVSIVHEEYLLGIMSGK